MGDHPYQLLQRRDAVPGDEFVEVRQRRRHAPGERLVPVSAGCGFTQTSRYASRDSRATCSPSGRGSPRSQPSLHSTTTAPRAVPRCPHRSRNAFSDSARRVPPCQSGIAVAGGAQRRVRIAMAQRPGHPGQPGADREHLGRRRPAPHRGVPEAQQRVGVRRHRPGHVEQQHEPCAASAAAGAGAAAGPARRRRAASAAPSGAASTSPAARRPAAAGPRRGADGEHRDHPPDVVALDRRQRARRRGGAASRCRSRSSRSRRRRRRRRPAGTARTCRTASPRAASSAVPAAAARAPARSRRSTPRTPRRRPRQSSGGRAQRHPAGPVRVPRRRCTPSASTAASIVATRSGDASTPALPQRARELDEHPGHVARPSSHAEQRGEALARGPGRRPRGISAPIRGSRRPDPDPASGRRARPAPPAQSIDSATPGGLSRSISRIRATAVGDVGGQPRGDVGQPGAQDLDLALEATGARPSGTGSGA